MAAKDRMLDATVHLFAICPDHRGKALGIIILEAAMEIAVKNGKKAMRLDALKSNNPAQKMYEKAGFIHRGEQRLYAGNFQSIRGLFLFRNFIWVI